MPLITRQGKGSKLTIQEMDGNLAYLEGLAQGGGSLVNEEEIGIEFVDTLKAFESVGTDFTLPLTQIVNTKFTGIKKESVAGFQFEPEPGLNIEYKLENLNLLGLIDATILTLFLSEFGPPEEIIDSILSNKLSIDYTLQNLYLKTGEMEDFELAFKLISPTLKGLASIESNLELELGSYYAYETSFFGGSEHKFKFTEKGLNRNFLQSDSPGIFKGTISFEGEVDERPLLLEFNNLPGEEEVTSGFLYEDENGFVKVKRD